MLPPRSQGIFHHQDTSISGCGDTALVKKQPPCHAMRPPFWKSLKEHAGGEKQGCWSRPCFKDCRGDYCGVLHAKTGKPRELLLSHVAIYHQPDAYDEEIGKLQTILNHANWDTSLSPTNLNRRKEFLIEKDENHHYSDRLKKSNTEMVLPTLGDVYSNHDLN